ncbi:glutamyl-tRNA reductase [Limibacillus sp. MBR-115]|uniref:glutamyl-tRNA reductase n=1 Tax=Limibacillus sp. MBR-115 TaxID=3156465 RepID=UPI003392F70B
MAGSRHSKDLLLIGIDYRSAPEVLRDRLFQDEISTEEGLGALAAAGLKAAVLIATCERIDVILPAEQREDEQAARRWLASLAGAESRRLGDSLYRLSGEEALLHLWRIAASLESAMPGEPQVLGQVRKAERLAEEAGLLSPPLVEAFQAAFAAAKRVRRETALGERAVTMASAALQVARDLHGKLDSCRLLLLGLGEGLELFVGPFQSVGVQQVLVCHPNGPRADAAALRLGAHARRWEEREQALAEAEIVITGMASAHYSLEPDLLRRVIKARRHRPILVIDGGVPGDVNPSAGELEDIFLYDFDDLEGLALAGQSRRRLAFEDAKTILAEELERWRLRLSGRETAALLREAEIGLRALEADALSAGEGSAVSLLRQQLLERLTAMARGLGRQQPEERAALERLIKGLFSARYDDEKE